MKSTTLFAVAIGTIALSPAVSFAQNVSGTNVEANLTSTTVGNGNITIQDITQRAIDLQEADNSSPNVKGTSLKVNAETTTIGHHNIDIKKATQESLKIQRHR